MNNNSINKTALFESNKGFDSVATTYSRVSEKIPSDYIDLIRRVFDIDKKTPIIDLGCGSGLLTFELRNLSDTVQGLDASREMIRIARQRDSNSKITWICKPVEGFIFKKEFYSLIISFESFHLFPDYLTLIKRVYSALNDHGFFCIGWCRHHWEDFLKSCITESFKDFGILWDDWAYQSCPFFEDILQQSCLPFSDMRTERIIVPLTSNIHSVAQYLTCIHKAQALNEEQKMNLAKSLEQKFLELSHSDHLSGESTYFISYVSKRTE